MKKILSFDLEAEMGFLKKPDINEKVYLTYNLLHKPALLGILGAIAGLKGYEKNNELPEYYKLLHHIPVGIQPTGVSCNQGNFSKTITAYNNTTGFASSEEGGNLIISEQTLLKPSYRIYLLLDLENETEELLFNRIKKQEAEYIPYLGKNDHSVWWRSESVQEYEIKPFGNEVNFTVVNAFLKKKPLVDEAIRENNDDLLGDYGFSSTGTFMYFEKLPIDFNSTLYQYNYGDFAFTDWLLTKESKLANLFEIEIGKVVQLN